jgi:magnesium-protoporphyrin IX monomethyl ester (oxidative) cyclase
MVYAPMRRASDRIEAVRGKRGMAARLTRWSGALVAGLAFARLYLQPVRSTVLPEKVRLQPIW